jgi:hypothetical protein
MRVDRLDELRCVARIAEPGGIKSQVVHVWRHRRRVVARIAELEAMEGCPGTVLKSKLDPAAIPADPTGRWSCSIETEAGQLVGRREITVVRPAAPAEPEPAAAPGRDGGAGKAE